VMESRSDWFDSPSQAASRAASERAE
jgi:hypothetical protein